MNNMNEFLHKSAKEYDKKERKKMTRKLRNKTPLVQQFLKACKVMGIGERVATPSKPEKVKSNLTSAKKDKAPTAYKIARHVLGRSMDFSKKIGFHFLSYKQGDISFAELTVRCKMDENTLLTHFNHLL